MGTKQPKIRSGAANYPRMIACESPDYHYRVAFVRTPHGIVGVYDQRTRDAPLTRLEVVSAGRVHVVTWDRTFTDRRLKTLARRFAADRSEEGFG